MLIACYCGTLSDRQICPGCGQVTSFQGHEVDAELTEALRSIRALDSTNNNKEKED